jgi:hypothetical protein
MRTATGTTRATDTTTSTGRRPGRGFRLLAAGAAAAVLGASAIAMAPAGAEASEWTRIQPPAGIRPLATLNAVAAGSATRAWAVGQEYAGTHSSQIPGVPLVLQMNGGTWTRTALRGVTWKGSLTSVAATSPSDAWAAGVDTANGPRLLHFDGTAWRPAEPPVTGTVSSLRLVASPGHQPWLFVTPTGGTPVVLQRTGGAWQTVELPPAPFTPAAVHVAVDGTVWLAGYRLQQIPGFPLSVPILVVQRRSGTGWAALPEGPQVSPRQVLAATDGTLWVAGAVPRTGPGGPIGVPPPSALVHWDGTAWTQASLGTSFVVPTLAGDDAGRPEWASGTFTFAGGQPTGGYLKYAGGTWTRVPGAPVVAPELDRVSITGLAHLPGTTSTLAVGQAPYPFEEQRVPRIEREDAP